MERNNKKIICARCNKSKIRSFAHHTLCRDCSYEFSMEVQTSIIQNAVDEIKRLMTLRGKSD